MAVTILPNIWSQMLEGFGRGTQMGQENYWRKQQMQRDDARDERARQAQMFQALLQANAQTGNVSYEDVNRAAQELAKTSPEFAQFKLAGPSAPELRQNIGRGEFGPSMVQGPGMQVPMATRKFSDAQYELVGLKTPEQRYVERETGTLGLRGAKANVALGEHKASPEVLSLEQSKMIYDVFGRMAPGAADQAIVALGGVDKLNSNTIKTAAASAASAIAQSPAFRRFGQLGTEQLGVLEQEIASQLLDRSVQWFNANTNRMAVSLRGSTGVPEWVRTVDKLNATIEARRKEINDLVSQNNWLNMYSSGLVSPEGLKKTNPTMYNNVVEFKTRLETLRSEMAAAQKQVINIMSGEYPRDELAERQGVAGLPELPGTTGNPMTSQLGISPVRPDGATVAPPAAPKEYDLTQEEYNDAVMKVNAVPRGSRRSYIENSPFTRQVKDRLLRAAGLEIR